MVNEVKTLFSGIRTAVLSAKFPKLKKKRSRNARKRKKG